jgi:hypothetical protein
MQNSSKSSAFHVLAQLTHVANKASANQVKATSDSQANALNHEINMVSNLGRMPRPWILWDLLRSKKETL